MSHPIERNCPTCGAEPSQRCVGKRGTDRKAFHRARGSRQRAHELVGEPDVVTESPIEKMLAGAILGWLAHNDIDATVTTQTPIGPYRADILVQQSGSFLVIECDGRRYHNTRDQVLRDKRRDRYCVARGYGVMRFAGSEICKDVRGCAAEVGLWIRRP